jgi:YgiT-type zinc finger domain-containing protein
MAEMSEILERPCPSCGGTMVRDARRDRIEYKGLSVEVEQPGWHCRCGEAVLSESDLAAGLTLQSDPFSLNDLRKAFDGVLAANAEKQ